MAGGAAHAVVIVHLVYLLYVLLGGLLALRTIRWLWPHLVTTFWGVVGALTKVACPLTLLEKDLLTRAGTKPYDGTFISHHVAGVYYPADWQAGVWYATALFVLACYAVAVSRHLAMKRVLTHWPFAPPWRGGLTTPTAAGGPRGSRRSTARR